MFVVRQGHNVLTGAGGRKTSPETAEPVPSFGMVTITGSIAAKVAAVGRCGQRLACASVWRPLLPIHILS